jgi:toxin HigB-1
MIRTWKSEDLETVFYGRSPKGFPSDLIGKTRRLLAQLNAAVTVQDMAAPPGNRLHIFKRGVGRCVVGECQYAISTDF